MATRREHQAAETRRAILRAARELFAEHGYAATSVARVATTAGVSVQTIYDSVGSKAALVAAMNDLIHEEAGIDELLRHLAALDQPVELVAAPVRITRRIIERSGDIVRASIGAASTEPQLAAIVEEGSVRHRHGIERITAELDRQGVLRAPRDEATDVLAALTDVRAALLFVDGYGWDLDRWQTWTEATLPQLLLAG